MKFCTFASGSSGNCALLSNGDTHLLIDAGISMRRIKCSLEKLGLTFADLDGILITHSHSDHIKALKMLIKYHNIPMFASNVTALEIINQLPEARDRITGFPSGTELEFGSVSVKPFETPHDAPGSVGYRFDADGRSFAVLTDIGYITQHIYDTICGVDACMLEANHDIPMLMNGKYPYYLKERILSKYGHLSNPECGKLAAALADNGARRVILAHLSSENNTPRLARDAVQCALADRDVELCVAPRDEMGEVYII